MASGPVPPSETEAATSGHGALPRSITTAASTSLPCAAKAKRAVPHLVWWAIRWHV